MMKVLVVLVIVLFVAHLLHKYLGVTDRTAFIFIAIAAVAVALRGRKLHA